MRQKRKRGYFDGKSNRYDGGQSDKAACCLRLADAAWKPVSAALQHGGYADCRARRRCGGACGCRRRRVARLVRSRQHHGSDAGLYDFDFTALRRRRSPGPAQGRNHVGLSFRYYHCGIYHPCFTDCASDPRLDEYAGGNDRYGAPLYQHYFLRDSDHRRV